jgi:hypothetical protein
MNDAGLVVGILHPNVGNRTRAFAWSSLMSILPDKGYAAEAWSVNRTGAVAGAVEITS